MTATAPALQGSHGKGMRDAWNAAPERARNTARVVAVLAMVLAAYHYSLLSLLQTLGLETPLAYVGLVPVIALVLAGIRARTARPHLPIYDRQLDYIVGLPLLVVALGINLVFPSRLSSMFWVWRIDLLSLPFFVAGAVCTVFGIRTMWRQGLAIGFLFLAWPLPYNLFLSKFLESFTNLTLTGLRVLLHAVPVAETVASGDGSLFRVEHGGSSFLISVVSACSGVNGMVGFLLVGVAFGAVVHGPRVRKALWLGGGMLLLWFLNLLRILFIFVVGRTGGESLAINVFHPFVGLITFNLGIIAMLLALRPLGLSIDHGAVASPPDEPLEAGPRRPNLVNRVAVPRVGAALALLTLVGGWLAVANSGLRAFDPVANALGAPKLASFTDFPATPDGWRAQKSDEYDWAKPYFGASSTWVRYVMFPGAGEDVALKSDQAVTADVISTSNLRSFSAYGVESCYRFHGYKLRDVAAVDVGAGVTGQALSFHNTKQQQDWTVVSWIWPVKTGEATRYERVTLYVQNSVNATFPGGVGAGIHSTGRGLGGDIVERRLVAARAFLVDVARGVVRNQTGVQIGTTLPAENNFSPGARTQLRRSVPSSTPSPPS